MAEEDKGQGEEAEETLGGDPRREQNEDPWGVRGNGSGRLASDDENCVREEASGTNKRSLRWFVEHGYFHHMRIGEIHTSVNPDRLQFAIEAGEKYTGRSGNMAPITMDVARDTTLWAMHLEVVLKAAAYRIPDTTLRAMLDDCSRVEWKDTAHLRRIMRAMEVGAAHLRDIIERREIDNGETEYQ